VDQDPATDFYTCKACHLDDGPGGHFEWQLVVDNPPLWASVRLGTDLTPAQEAQYAYTTRLMNDVHMSHAMEFPYPQSASNCVVCHEGKLDVILTDANFVGETCLSCHAVTGAAPGTEPELFYEKKAPALVNIMPAIHGAVDTDYIKNTPCNGCHEVGGIAGTALFSDIHTGYDVTIYADAAGTKYSDIFVVTIDNASFAGNTLTIEFSATGSGNGLTEADIAPTVLVGLYGWDSKDYYVGPHERDFDDNGDGSVTSADQRNLEYVVGRTNHPRFTTVSSGGGSWVVTADLSAWADNVATGVVKQVEIGVMPRLENPALDNAVVALNAPSRTFSLVTNAFIPNYYSGTNALVRVDNGCNNCHEALADTFHSPDRGGNIVVCRLCHITKDAGSHLEFQSRSIDSYAHGIHSFQPFDINNIDFSDPVQALHYEDHIRFAFPTLGRTNCESCHNPGMYNVPDQSKSMPGLLSASEFPIIFENLEDFPDGQRQIQQVPSYITGPATRACGGCHRVNWINEDDAVELSAFYGHTATNGYLVETESATHNVDVLAVIDEVMPMFYP
jgi:OmcA/MtrC family decaheme c-type cytochrome